MKIYIAIILLLIGITIAVRSIATYFLQPKYERLDTAQNTPCPPQGIYSKEEFEMIMVYCKYYRTK